MSTPLLVASSNASSATQNADDSQLITIIASGTFGGGTLTLEYSADGATFVTAGLTLTADGVIQHRPTAGVQWRVTLAGATGASVTATAF